MGKKNKDQDPGIKISSVTNRDIIQRINFLYQASAYLGSISSVGEGTVANAAAASDIPASKRQQKKMQRRKERHPNSTSQLSRDYVKTMRVIGQKATVRIDPSVKRTLCKGCNALLIPGSTATIRVKPSSAHGNTVTYMCIGCKTIRRIPAPPEVDIASATLDQPGGSASQSSTDEVMADEDISGDLAQEAEHKSIVSPAVPKQRKGGPAPRIPPLFERDAGHVVFHGNTKLASVSSTQE